MTVIAFDTLAFANKLKGAGMSPNLAEVQAEEQGKIINDLVTNQLVTKQDLKEEVHILKMDMYSFTVKVAAFTVGILGGIQTLLHFLK
jgi:hypothetical protein